MLQVRCGEKRSIQQIFNYNQLPLIMIKLVSRLYRFNLAAQCMAGNNKFATSKKIRDSDDLSLEQMQQLLGKPLSEKQKKPDNQLIAKSKSYQKQQKKDIVGDKKQYYYGLMPQINSNYPECLDPDEVIIQETPNQNIFNALNLPTNCSFNQYTMALNKFRTEADLYGDQLQKPVIANDSLEFKEVLRYDHEYLVRARNNLLVNLSIPGTIECEDPRNFMDLRPIQQFRHTPLIPISESYMQRHKQMLQRYHRKQFVFQVSTQSMISWALIIGCVGIASYLIYLILQKEEERTVKFSRMKYQRLVGQSSETPVFKI